MTWQSRLRCLRSRSRCRRPEKSNCPKDGRRFERKSCEYKLKAKYRTTGGEDENWDGPSHIAEGLGGLGQGRGCERLGIGFEGRKFLRTASRASELSNVKNDK